MFYNASRQTSFNLHSDMVQKVLEDFHELGTEAVLKKETTLEPFGIEFLLLGREMDGPLFLILLTRMCRGDSILAFRTPNTLSNTAM